MSPQEVIEEVARRYATVAGAPSDATTTAEWAKRNASLPISIETKLKLSKNWTSPDVEAAIAGYLAGLDPWRDTTKSFTTPEKNDLGLTADADEITCIARIRVAASMRDRLRNKAGAAETLGAKVAEKVKADTREIDYGAKVAEAQRAVSAQEPELYRAIEVNRAIHADRGRADFVRFSATNALALEARHIAKTEGCTIAEAQRRASQRWPELSAMRATGSEDVE